MSLILSTLNQQQTHTTLHNNYTHTKVEPPLQMVKTTGSSLHGDSFCCMDAKGRIPMHSERAWGLSSACFGRENKKSKDIV